MKSNIQFVNEKIENAFNRLKKEDEEFYRILERAFKDIENNAFCGIQIPKKLIPKEYIKKFGVRNLWKYNLPGAWRLIYNIKGKNLLVFSIILEWMNHKEYEKRFNY
ncbi:hypothetical protein KAI04_02695 [Candidatus Pacearchaeota archaeon]|nr:hypothetical protein [Candidatus Pacearchaeota archaeon]